MKLITFPEPPDATVTLRHDNGQSFTGVPGFVADRPASIIELPADLPDKWGAQRVTSKEGYVSKDEHGVLSLESVNPVTGSVVFDVDTVKLTKAQGSHPFAKAQSGL